MLADRNRKPNALNTYDSFSVMTVANKKNAHANYLGPTELIVNDEVFLRL